MRSPRVYRALVRMYPSRFRREFGDSMVQLFGDRLTRDGARRTWARTARDLGVSLPYQYWETFMNANSYNKLVAAAIVTAVAAIGVILVGGAVVGLALLALLAWEVYAILHTRGHTLGSRTWWKFAGAGAGLFAVLFVVFAMPWPESWRSAVPGEVAWSVAMLGFSVSIVLVVTGAMIGLAHLGTRRHPSA